MSLQIFTPDECAQALTQRVRSARKASGWSQAEVAARAGIPLSTYSLFERSGEASFANVLKIAAVMGDPSRITEIIQERQYASLDEIEQQESKGSGRRRGLKL